MRARARTIQSSEINRGPDEKERRVEIELLRLKFRRRGDEFRAGPEIEVFQSKRQGNEEQGQQGQRRHLRFEDAA